MAKGKAHRTDIVIRNPRCFEARKREVGNEAQEEASPSTGRPAPTKEQLESAIKAYEYLYDVITRLYLKAHERRLTNSSMMAASLQTIHRRSEELMDIADWLHVAVHSSASALDALYANARKDLAEGKVYEIADAG